MRRQQEQVDKDLLSPNSSTTVGFFEVKAANKYLTSKGNDIESDSCKLRIVQIKVLDVLYNNELCSLVYIHDATNLYIRSSQLLSNGDDNNPL